jgi:NMD protein affecting ribosome stability and mRNA decay
MDVDLLQHLRPRRTLRSTKQPIGLVTCSLCLRVRRGSEWREAEQVIRELRSYELEAPPRLHSAVCEVCAESIFSRRVAEEIRVKAA